MKKIALSLISSIFLFGAAHAEESPAAGAVKEMVSAYKKSKSKGMQAEEESCWSTFKPRTEEAEGGLAYCGMVGFIGHLIDENAAQKEGRKIANYWTRDAIVERFVENGLRLKISEKKIEALMESAYVEDSEEIAKHLLKAGYQ